jgi:hypothetical protein
VANHALEPCNIADLIGHGALGLRLAAGQASALKRAVVSAQIYMGPADEGRLGPDELVLLVAGWSSGPEEPARLAEVLAAAKVAAVGLPDTISADFSQGIAAQLAQRGVAVLMVPRTTRFADIIDTVSRAHASPDTARFQRMVSMQRSLVAELDAIDAVDSLLRRLARLVEGTAGIADDSGVVEASTGVLPYVLLRREVGNFQAPLVEVDVAGWHGVANKLKTLPRQPQRRLFVASRRAGFVDAYVRAAAGITASLLDATKRIEVLALNQDRAVRRSVLNRALSLEPYESTEVLAERASALGLTFQHEVRVIIFLAAPARRRKLEWPAVTDAVYETLTPAKGTLFVAGREDHLITLLEAVPDFRMQNLQAVVRQFPGLVAGVGRRIDRIDEVPVSYHDATLAAHYSLSGKTDSVVSYDHLGFSIRLLADLGHEQMMDWTNRILGPLQGKPLLMEAIETYFDHDQDITSASRALQIHPNTLRYRLSRIEEAIGSSIRSPATVTALHLALAAAAARGDLDAVERALVPSVAAGRRVADVAPEASVTDAPLGPAETAFGAASAD